MKKILCWLAAAGALSACATSGLADDRHGYVSKVYAVGEMPTGLPECLARLTPDQLAGGRFVDLKYGIIKLRKYATAVAPAGMQLAEHDKVEFSPLACEGGDYPRINNVVAG